MKKVLITAKNSFIGNSFAQYMKPSGDWQVHKCSLREEGWEQGSWTGYDAILHVAGISQVDIGVVSAEQEADYYRVNATLTQQVAKKAKQDGVRQLIYLSSIMVYGNPSGLHRARIIGTNSIPTPASIYGKSKLLGEKITELSTDDFIVSVVRSPMVYGREQSGELQSWNRLSGYLFIFPKIENYRGMIYIDNLCELICQLILTQKGGLVFPQDEKALSTSELICELRRLRGKRTILLPGFHWLMRLGCRLSQKFNLLLGNLGYEAQMTRLPQAKYQLVKTEEALYQTFMK